MKFSQIAIAALAVVAAASANATITGAIVNDSGPLLTLTNDGSFMSGSTLVATEVGGDVLSSSTSSSTEPVGTIGNYLSDLGTHTTKVSFVTGESFVSFLWGTPDAYNQLLVNDTLFTATSLSFPSDAGIAGTGKYVAFTASAGELITSLTFTNSPAVNSFETANYSIAPVPEPETYALMLGGLGLVGWISRRRRS